MLTTNVEAARDRFEIGDVTRTDVAQSEARQALARSELEFARGRLTSSEENYRRVIGQRPGVLAPPPPLPPLPAIADQAVQIALANNPDFIAIQRQAEAARYDIRVAEAARLPTVSGVASGDYVNTLAGETGGAPRSGHSLNNYVGAKLILQAMGDDNASQIAQLLALEHFVAVTALDRMPEVSCRCRCMCCRQPSSTEQRPWGAVHSNAGLLSSLAASMSLRKHLFVAAHLGCGACPLSLSFRT